VCDDVTPLEILAAPGRLAGTSRELPFTRHLPAQDGECHRQAGENAAQGGRDATGSSRSVNGASQHHASTQPRRYSLRR
jgi:hypothetical protein